jgi:hypothetical protein
MCTRIHAGRSYHFVTHDPRDPRDAGHADTDVEKRLRICDECSGLWFSLLPWSVRSGCGYVL